MTYNHLVSVPYNEMNCWELVADVLGMTKFKAETPRERIRLKGLLLEEFEEVQLPLKIHDVISQGTHVGIIIPGGILHARDPYSEFIPTEDFSCGICSGENYGKPKFYRRIK